jgi:hemin uptake protein HemP
MPDDPTPLGTPTDDGEAPESRSGHRTIRTEELFGDNREIWIEHDGERYRLRITRRNKLILQK